MTNKEMEQRFLIKKIALNAIKLEDTRTLDEKLADIEVMAEDYKNRRAAEQVSRIIDSAKETGDGDMFEQPKKSKSFSWEDDLGC